MTILAPSRLVIPPQRSGYLPGEVIKVEMLGINGARIGPRRFTILESPGSGFAGQVYHAVCHAGAPREVAVKVMRPRSAWKAAVRDSLFWVCFQAPFAPRFREEALCCGLLWQAILRAAADQSIAPGAVARPLGYYWDADLASFAEVHEWIDSRPIHYEPDDLLVARWLGRTHIPDQTEMARKHDFMDRLAALCREIGAMGLARQYDWYTLVSQVNVLNHPQEEGPHSHFVAVDCRVGIAFPFFLPFTPVHLRISLEGLRRGVFVHYDEVDFSRLDAYLSTHPELAESLAPLVECLRRSDARYRARLPNLWHTHIRLLVDPVFRSDLRESAAGDWVRARLAVPETAGWLCQHPWIFALLSLLLLLPVYGQFLVRLFAYPAYRGHIRAILYNPSYRDQWLAENRARDLAFWQADHRIPARHALRLADSMSAFLGEKITCAWLPRAIHYLLVDPEARRQFIRASVIRPLRLLYRQSERINWLGSIIQSQRERGLIRPARTAILLDQIREPRMAGFVRDLGFTAGLDVIARLVYLLLGIYGIATGDLFPLGLAMLGPVPPSGPLRLLYVLMQTVIDLIWFSIHREKSGAGHLLTARLSALLICPWRGIGNLFPILELSAYYPRLALLLADHFASRAARWIPVFGGPGKLLEYWIFQTCYNVPVGIRKLVKGEG